MHPHHRGHTSTSHRVFMVVLVLVIIALVSTLTFLRLFPYEGEEYNVIVAVYFYIWYGNPENNHWNSSAWNIVVDKPLIGYYSSMDDETIKWQLRLIRDAGIDVLFISWWGPGSYEDRVAEKVFSYLKDFGLKACIFIEPYLGSKAILYDREWWSHILDYVNSRFIQKFSNVYFKWNGKPLILAFYPVGVVFRPSDSRFTIRIVGLYPYTDWSYWIPLPRIEKDGYIAVLPRFDSYYLYLAGSRPFPTRIDIEYKFLYDVLWNYILLNKHRIRLIAICSWNEYHERTMIEPHYDRTAPNTISPYEKTREYIMKLKGKTVILRKIYENKRAHTGLPVGLNLKKLKSFLEGQYVSEAKLLRAAVYAYPDNVTIWVCSDNLLAARALMVLGSPLGEGMLDELASKYGGGYDGLHEVLLAMPIPDTFYKRDNITLGEVYSKKYNTILYIKREKPGLIPIINWDEYADLVVYKALNMLLKRQKDQAEKLFEKLMEMWDGYGFRDKVYHESGKYETYKLALAIYLYRALKAAKSNIIEKYEDNIKKLCNIISTLQRADGGMVTHYEVSHDIIRLAGDVNTETTAITTLALYSYYPEIIGCTCTSDN